MYVSSEPNGLNMVFHTITIARIIYTVRNRSLLKTHLLTVNLKRPLRMFELAYDSQIFGVDIIRNFFQKLLRFKTIYLVIWPAFVIDLTFNVVKNLSKNRRLSWIGVSISCCRIGDCCNCCRSSGP